MATSGEVRNFFADVEGEQGSESRPLLPTRVKDGAPKGGKWLMHFVEGQVEIRHAKADEHPYINYQAEIEQPEEYAERTVFGMFFFPRPLADGASEQDGEKHQGQMKRVVGQIDAILGLGTCASLEGGTLEETLSELVPLLENTAFVGKVGFEKGKKVDADDDSKDAERYPDKNRITFFEPEDTWVGETDTENFPF